MKKILLYFVAVLMLQTSFAQTVFDSNEKAVEVKLAPAVSSTTNTNNIQNLQNIQTKDTNTTYKPATSIKEVKFNNALVNLDDAQVELRQELSDVNSRYTSALNEKEKAIQTCKVLKREINSINKKMRNVEKSKKIISKNLEVKK